MIYHNSGNFCNDPYSESSSEKCMAFQIMAWSLIVHKILLKINLFSLFLDNIMSNRTDVNAHFLSHWK